MARIIDLGLKKPDDPIYTEEIRIISIRKFNPISTPSPSTKPADQPLTPDQDPAAIPSRKDHHP